MTPAPLTLARIRELRSFGPIDRIELIGGSELNAALAAAEALARLEAWLSAPRSAHFARWQDGRLSAALTPGNASSRDCSTLLAALTAALDQAEAKP